MIVSRCGLIFPVPPWGDEAGKGGGGRTGGDAQLGGNERAWWFAGKGVCNSTEGLE